MGSIAAVLLFSLITAAAGTATAIYQNESNKKAVAAANETNISMQEQINKLNMELAQNANTFSAAEAEKQRKWSEQMSNTQYQRAMADMQAAGLNPILAGNLNNAGSYQGGYAAQANLAAANAARVNPVKTDLTGVTNAIQSMSNMLMMSMILGNKNNSGTAKGLADQQKAASFKQQVVKRFKGADGNDYVVLG